MSWLGGLLKTTRIRSLALRTGGQSTLRHGASSATEGKRTNSILNMLRSSDAPGRWSTWWLLRIRHVAITLWIEGPYRCLLSLLTNLKHMWALASLKDSKRSRMSSSEGVGSLILIFKRASSEQLRLRELLRIASMNSLIRKWFLESST